MFFPIVMGTIGGFFSPEMSLAFLIPKLSMATDMLSCELFLRVQDVQWIC